MQGADQVQVSGVEALNERVLRGVLGWLQAGERCWLATVVSTYGSSPRPIGSLFAFNPLQGTLGSLSGGCIEEDLQVRLASKADGPAELPILLRYGVTQEEQIRYALPCGGELQVLLEDLRPELGLVAHFEELLGALLRRQPVVRLVSLVNGARSLKVDPRATFSCDAELLCHPLSPAHRLLLVGAGEVAFYVAQFALALDFEVTLCDPRESFFKNWTLPGVEAFQCLPDDLIRERFHDAQCAILALAHDPRIDDMALLEALGNTEAFYIGAMGSKTTSLARRERLAELGLDEAQLARLHAPIGLPIGSKTPAEIAISVLAHVIAERSRQRKHAAAEMAESNAGEIRSGCQVIPSSSKRKANG